MTLSMEPIRLPRPPEGVCWTHETAYYGFHGSILGSPAVPTAAQIAPGVPPTGPGGRSFAIVDAATGETLLEQNAGAAWSRLAYR